MHFESTHHVTAAMVMKAVCWNAIVIVTIAVVPAGGGGSGDCLMLEQFLARVLPRPSAPFSSPVGLIRD